ncbi:MAG: transposase [Negativicutes bacterium]|nr:transposase [Negativicutes bacterium]
MSAFQVASGIFGYRRMRLNPERRCGLHCNLKRIYKVMRTIRLKSVIRRERPNYIKSTPEPRRRIFCTVISWQRISMRNG